jgi:hypothetical protein
MPLTLYALAGLGCSPQEIEALRAKGIIAFPPTIRGERQ